MRCCPRPVCQRRSTSRRPTSTAYYDKHKSEFMTPETVALQYLKLDLADIAADVQVTEEALRKYYDENAAAQYATPERRRPATS